MNMIFSPIEGVVAKLVNLVLQRLFSSVRGNSNGFGDSEEAYPGSDEPFPGMTNKPVRVAEATVV